MDDMFLYHASNFFERCLFCANSHVGLHIKMDDVYIYHAHNFFGAPWISAMAGNKNSGRPEYVPTDDEREKVRVLKAGGMSNEAIAEAVAKAIAEAGTTPATETPSV